MMLLLFFIGLFAGTVDAIAGGGGLISLPILLSIGMPPHVAFGTNKLQGTIGTFIASYRYYQHGWISIRSVYPAIIAILFGGSAGALVTQLLSSDILRQIIPSLLGIILLYTLFSPALGNKDHEPRLNPFWVYLVAGFVMGFYDGFFGPGTGAFWVFILTFFLGFNLIKATAYTKIFNLSSSFMATIWFAAGNNIDYRIALVMAAGQLFGSRLGASLAIKKGANLIRPLFLFIVTMTIASLVYKSYSDSMLFLLITHAVGIIPQVLAAFTILISIFIIYFKRTRKENKLI